MERPLHTAIALLLFAVSVSGVARAAPITIDFNGTVGEGASCRSTSIVEDGFIVSRSSGLVNLLDNDFQNDIDITPFDDDILEWDSPFATVQIVRVGGGTFSALSFLGGAFAGNGNLMFVGTGGGGPVQSFGFAEGTFTAASLSGFTNITSLGIIRTNSTAGGPVIDDLVLDAAPVPEPSSLALVALGVAGVIARRRRNQSP